MTIMSRVCLMPSRFVWCLPVRSDAFPLVWISGLLFDSRPYLLSLFCLVLLLFLSRHFSANGPVLWLFSGKFSKHFCMALVEWLGDEHLFGRWYMQLANRQRASALHSLRYATLYKLWEVICCFPFLSASINIVYTWYMAHWGKLEMVQIHDTQHNSVCASQPPETFSWQKHALFSLIHFFIFPLNTPFWRLRTGQWVAPEHLS